VAEHDSDREGLERTSQGVPFDEEAAWAAIVAGYGDEPKDRRAPSRSSRSRDLALLDPEKNDEKPKPDEPAKPSQPLGSSVSFAPGVGPRDHTGPEPAEEDFDDDDEGHFVPPEPPPLPAADTTAKFAWLG